MGYREAGAADLAHDALGRGPGAGAAVLRAHVLPTLRTSCKLLLTLEYNYNTK